MHFLAPGGIDISDPTALLLDVFLTGHMSNWSAGIKTFISTIFVLFINSKQRVKKVFSPPPLWNAYGPGQLLLPFGQFTFKGLNPLHTFPAALSLKPSAVFIDSLNVLPCFSKKSLENGNELGIMIVYT